MTQSRGLSPLSWNKWLSPANVVVSTQTQETNSSRCSSKCLSKLERNLISLLVVTVLVIIILLTTIVLSIVLYNAKNDSHFDSDGFQIPRRNQPTHWKNNNLPSQNTVTIKKVGMREDAEEETIPLNISSEESGEKHLNLLSKPIKYVVNCTSFLYLQFYL